MVLMERAGLAVFHALQEMLPEGGSIGIVCGKGNNGGDGFVVGRHALSEGYAVECIATANQDELNEDCRCQMLQAIAQGVRVTFPDHPRWERVMKCLGKFDMIVDAILGTGAQGQVNGKVAEAIYAMNRSGIPVLAVDVPSGIHTDTGHELADSVWAIRTVTFGFPKPFLFQGIGVEHSGHWTIADIGYPRAIKNQVTGARLIDQKYVGSFLPERFRSSHKGANGTVLIVAGSKQMRGAAVLATNAAIRSGVGLVTVAAIDSVCDAIITHCPEATLLPLPELEGTIAPDAANIVLNQQSRFDAALFGPGLTHNDNVADFFARLWPRWEVKSCLDADALNAVAQGLRLPPAPCVLTPHPGEMSRLLACHLDEVQDDRFTAVKSAVDKFAKTVLLKGAYSVVGAPDEPLNVNQTGNPGMASAGMGDVLSGVITTLLAQDIEPYDAASCAMFWHGLAGDLAAKKFGPIGFTATDVAQMLPKARLKLTTELD